MCLKEIGQSHLPYIFLLLIKIDHGQIFFRKEVTVIALSIFAGHIFVNILIVMEFTNLPVQITAHTKILIVLQFQ